MDHFDLLWKARTIEKYRQKYENEKINSILMSESDIPEKTIFQRWRHYKHGMQKRLSRTFSKWYPEGSTVSNFLVSFRTDMRLPSILLRSLYGFVGGLLLTYLGFMFFVFQLSLSLMHATVLSSILGVLLTLGLTFSNRIRCLIFLLVPQLFSRVGRYTLTCYALVLILTGPATNTLKNSEVLSESMACSQEQIKLSVRHINDSFKKPFNSVKDSLKITMDSLKMIVRKLKIALIRINRLILSIASVIQSSFSWLSSVADVCNNALGTPQERCMNTLKNNLKYNNKNMNHNEHKDIKKSVISYIENLLDAIGVKNVKRYKHEDIEIKDTKRPQDKDYFTAKNIELTESKVNFKNTKRSTVEFYHNPWFCNKANAVNVVCGLLKQYDKFCVPADFAEETFLATIRKKLKTFVHRISKLIHVQLNIQHTYTFIGNNSSTNQVATGIVTEIRNRADPILTWLSWSSCVTSLFLLLIICRAKHYQHMFETRSRFDNRFITKEFRELDLKRLREGRETVLPLNRRERAKYVTTTSFRLVASEKFHLNRSAVFVTVTTFKLLIHIVADYSLYWVLMIIRHHGKLQSPLQPGVADTGTFFTGIGFVARLLQSFIDTLNVQLCLPPPDNSCLPNPYPPNINRYCQIGFLIVLIWFFAIFEPYGLRLRHLIMGHYRPQRAQARAVWLYNHILRTRASFMKFARRKLHREYKYSSQSKFTFRRSLQSYIPFHWLRSLLGIKSDESRCLLCNISDDTSDPAKEVIKCEVPNCPGTYCSSCFSNIGQLCTICLSPADYGDISDFSLEKGSSDEDDGEDSDDMERDDNRRNLDHGANTLEEANATTSRTSRIGKQSRGIRLFEKNESKCGEMIPLIKHCVTISDPYIHRLYRIQKTEIIANETTVVINRNRCIFLRYESQQTSKMQVHKDDVKLFKDHNNNNVHAYSMIPTSDLFQYSAYEISKNPFEIKRIESTTKLAKYLRKNKVIRCKQKTIAKKPKYFMTCSYNNLCTISGTAANVDNSGEHAKDSGRLEKLSEKAKKKGRNKKAKQPKDIKSKNDITKSSHHTLCRRKIKKISATFSRCWKNMKMTVSSCNISSSKTKKDLPPIKEQKHKRKKKPKLVKNETSKADKKAEINKTNEDNIGNSRIFAYLDGLDWAKSRFENQHIAQVNDQKQDSAKSSQRPDRENEIVKNMAMLRLDLSSLTESKLEPQRQDNMCLKNNLPSPANQETLNIQKGSDVSSGALEKIVKLILCSSCDCNENFSLYNTDSSEKNDFAEVFSNFSVEKSVAVTNTDSLHRVPCVKFNSQEDLKRVQNKRLSYVRPFSILQSICSLMSHIKKIESICYGKWDRIARKNVHMEDKKSIEKEVRIEIEDKKVQPLIDLCLQDPERKPKQLQQTNDEGIQTKIECNLIETDNKSIEALPTKHSCACQIKFRSYETKDFAVQVTDTSPFQRRKPISEGYEVGVMTGNPTCTCAIQYQNRNKDCGVNPCRRKKWLPDNEDSEKALTLDDDETLVDSNDSRTDTTICGHANVNCHKTMVSHRNDKVERRRVKVVTKTNQSTLTDKPKHCNVGTATYDWWSPIVEKKDIVKIEHRQIEKKKRDFDLPRQRERKVFKNRGMTTGEKFVSFKSKTQFIPYRETGYRDIMSPSRYLLESQKYYNELFYNNYASPRVVPVANLQHIQKSHHLERDSPQLNCRHHKHRSRKTKRLEESYSLRRQESPRMRKVDSARTPETSRRNRRTKNLR